MNKQNFTVLVAEDDADDRLLIQAAFNENTRPVNLRFVTNGSELLNYLHNNHPDFRKLNPMPSIILLDLNMPEPDGRNALITIKTDPVLKVIPTLVLTGIINPHEVSMAYTNGSKSFISKPNSYERLVYIIKGIEHYWFDLSQIPTRFQ